MLVLALHFVPARAGWNWDPVPGADGYRLYWVVAELVPTWFDEDGDGVAETLALLSPAGLPDWSACERIETTTTSVPLDLPEPATNEIVFVIVTTFNSAGESGTGWNETTTHGPVAECQSGTCAPYPTFPCP